MNKLNLETASSINKSMQYNFLLQKKKKKSSIFIDGKVVVGVLAKEDSPGLTRPVSPKNINFVDFVSLL